MSFKIIATLLLSVAFLFGCSSSKLKERKEQREKVAQSSKVYCEFINGDNFPDIDVAVNLEMAKRCDMDKPFSMTQYNTRSDSTGVMYCCSVSPSKMSAQAAPAMTNSGKKAEPKKSDPKDDEIIE
jgi:hypothetical protein